VPTSPTGVTQAGLVILNPLARIFEFVLGMCVAHFWRTRPLQLTAGKATALELAAVAVSAVAVYFSTPLSEAMRATPLGEGGKMWVEVAGSAWAFALLVYIVAHGRGAVSRALSVKPLVLLGEISYSLYLLHQILLVAYTPKAIDYPHVPPAVSGLVFLTVALLASYLVWHFVEMPMRRLLVGRQRLHGSSVALNAPTERRVWGVRPVLAAGVFAALLFGINASLARPMRATLAPLPGTPRAMVAQACNLEAVDDLKFHGPEVMKLDHRVARISGWFVSHVSKRPGVPATMRSSTPDGLQGWEGPIVSWYPRPDVLKAMGIDSAEDVGFVAQMDLSALPPGRYNLALGFEDGGTAFLCNPRTIELTSAAPVAVPAS
jgi:hypothetical protein